VGTLFFVPGRIARQAGHGGDCSNLSLRGIAGYGVYFGTRYMGGYAMKKRIGGKARKFVGPSTIWVIEVKVGDGHSWDFEDASYDVREIIARAERHQDLWPQHRARVVKFVRETF
jgi:hypothetical protein